MKKMISSFLVVVLIMVLLCACTTSPASLPVSPIENDLQGTWCYKENYSEYSFTFDNGKFTETVKVGSLESTTVGTYEIDEADEVAATEEAETDEAAEADEEGETEEEAEEDIQELPEMPEEDARYLPREVVIYDENADDATPAEPEMPEEEADAEEMYSLHFFEDEEDTESNTESENIENVNEKEPEEKQDEPYDPEKPRRVDARFDFVELFVFTLAIVLFISSFIIRHSVVVGASMENTLYEGERLLVSDLFYTPNYGDIIVFEDHSTNAKTAIVKRVIGLPGDTIKITETSIYRNDSLLIEDFVFIDNPAEYKYKELEIVVPEGEIFVLGDHRNRSDDSRVFGTIDEDSVIGRVLLRFYPFSRFGTVD